ncbi:MAG TPA: hypothetical protein VND23_06820 [Acidimicrobiales bacterium]|nr:hypothetical protein [Acidimicrobiales bacterium]
MRKGARRRDAARLDSLERAITAIEREVRTRRLVVVDDDGDERVVAEVADGHAELRLDLPRGQRGQRSSVLIFATPPSAELGEGVGLQLWGDGDSLLELCAWRSGGRWNAQLRRVAHR